MELINAQSSRERNPMADSTAATLGPSGGDRPVGHWGWNNFFLFESVTTTLVAPGLTISLASRNLDYHLLRTVTVLSSIMNPTNPNFGQIWLRLGFGLEASDGG